MKNGCNFLTTLYGKLIKCARSKFWNKKNMLVPMNLLCTKTKIIMLPKNYYIKKLNFALAPKFKSNVAQTAYPGRSRPPSSAQKSGPMAWA